MKKDDFCEALGMLEGVAQDFAKRRDIFEVKGNIIGKTSKIEASSTSNVEVELASICPFYQL